MQVSIAATSNQGQRFERTELRNVALSLDDINRLIMAEGRRPEIGITQVWRVGPQYNFSQVGADPCEGTLTYAAMGATVEIGPAIFAKEALR